MRRCIALVLLIGLVPLLITGCDDEHKAAAEKPTESATSQNGRWYNQEQVNRGNILYQANCASCHKPDTSGTSEWKRLDNHGRLPPPPLNGSAHTWHHPLSILRRTVRNGGIPLGGSMPPFGAKLSPQQIDDILAWVQSHWPNDTYNIWDERNSMANKRANKG